MPPTRRTTKNDEELLARLADATSVKVLNEIRSDMRTHEARVTADIDGLRNQLEKDIGKLSEDGKGGTGLTGQIARTNERVDQLFNLRFVGAGMLLALSLTGALIFMGVKQWIAQTFESLLR